MPQFDCNCCNKNKNAFATAHKDKRREKNFMIKYMCNPIIRSIHIIKIKIFKENKKLLSPP